jgi:hypothetical protein
MNLPLVKTSTPVKAGKVGVFYFADTKVITHFANFPQDGTIVSALAVLVADNDAALKLAIAEAGLIERK